MIGRHDAIILLPLGLVPASMVSEKRSSSRPLLCGIPPGSTTIPKGPHEKLSLLWRPTITDALLPAVDAIPPTMTSPHLPPPMMLHPADDSGLD